MSLFTFNLLSSEYTLDPEFDQSNTLSMVISHTCLDASRRMNHVGRGGREISYFSFTDQTHTRPTKGGEKKNEITRNG